MNKLQIEKYLSGSDLRSIAKSGYLTDKINTQQKFDLLISFLFHPDRLIIMRAADVAEKISVQHPEWLNANKKWLFKLSKGPSEKELKWHLALMIPRLNLTKTETGECWKLLADWALNRSESKIVRVNSIQGLFEMLTHAPELKKDFDLIAEQLQQEQIPSINARIRILNKALKIRK